MTLSLHCGKGGYWWLIIRNSNPPQIGVISPKAVIEHDLELP